MFPLACLCLTLLMGFQYANGNPVQHFEYNLQDGGVLWLHMVPASWFNAALRCQLEDGVLAAPTSDELARVMQAAIKEHKLTYKDVFIGATDLLSKGEFKTLDGDLEDVPLDWAEDQPNKEYDAENCLVLTRAGKLADSSCSSVLPYFCYKKPSIIITSSTETPTSVKPQCPQGYEFEPRTSSCYKLHKEPKNWPKALGTCYAEGAHLAIINSDVESTVLKEIGDKLEIENYHIYIGFMKLGSEWLTVTGETLEKAGFQKWDQGEPSNNDGVEFCGSISAKGLLNDAPCSSHAWSFICEYNP